MKNIFQIVRLAKPLQRLLVLVTFFIAIGSLLTQAFPLIIRQIIDSVTSGSEINLKIEQILSLVVLLLVISLFSQLMTSLTERLGDHLAGKLRKLLLEKFYKKTLELPESYYSSQMSGKIINQLRRGITSISDFFNMATNFIIPIFLQTFIKIGIISYFNIWIGLLSILIFPIFIGISYYSSKQWGKKEEIKNNIDDKTIARISEVISNMKLVKGYGNQLAEFKSAENNLSEINKIFGTQSTQYQFFNFLRNGLVEIIIVLILGIIFYEASNKVFSLGTVVMLLQMVNQLRNPLFGMSFIIERIQQAEVNSKEYLEILSQESKEPLEKIENIHKEKSIELEMKNVSFKYEDGKQVLNNINIKTKKEEKIALVGASGAGKTTLINLIMRFYDVTTGDIYVNEQNYKELTHHYIRNNISLVFQDNELFSTTIRENVSYGGNYSEEEITNALKAANAYEFVMNFEKGVDTEIGERGVKLSGGQKQRIQIARAILKNAPLLILDEATSSLDAKSEHLIQEALENLMKGRLTIIIAHRFSTLQNVDRVIVLDKGEIVEDDSPSNLSKKEGIFKSLLDYQIKGNEKLLKKFELN